MKELILIVILLTVVFLGDVFLDFILDGIWWTDFYSRAFKLNFDKRRRPKHHHYKYY